MSKESIKIIDFEKFYEIDQDPSDFNIDYTNIEENDYYSEIELKLKGITTEVSKEKLSKLFRDAREPKLIRKFNGLSENDTLTEKHTDKYIGINLHKTIHISRVQASRFEFWNSIILQVPEYVEFVKWRSSKAENQSNNEIIKNSLILEEKQLIDFHYLAGPWWLTEMTRNGSDYSTTKKAFDLTSNFYRRWTLRTEMHINYIFISLIEFLSNIKWKNSLENLNEDYIHEYIKIFINEFNETAIAREINVNLLVALTEYLSTNEYLLSLPESIHNINYENYNKWLNSEKIEGPDDFKYSKSEISKFNKEFQKILSIYFRNPKFTTENLKKIKTYL